MTKRTTTNHAAHFSEKSADSISDHEFAQFQRLIFQIAGISLSDSKKVLLVGRLSTRLRFHGLHTFHQYYKYVTRPEHSAELQKMVDLLTTNETYFFREPKHFDLLRKVASDYRASTPFRVLSAASSSGEEAYSCAMVLADVFGPSGWEIVGTDISTRVLEKARGGHYSLERADGIPEKLLKKFCLRGVGEYAGTLLLSKDIRRQVSFEYSNLMAPNQTLGLFDIIFLRNVMIYFDADTKRKVVTNLLPFLKSTGLLIVGHSETLSGLVPSLETVQPTVYRRKRG